MRGEDAKQEVMFSYVSPERRVSQDHPLRPIREMVDGILKERSPRFARLYSNLGRPSIAPERLLRALLLQIFYSVRSERLRMEPLDYNLLFRWFVGMERDEAVWDPAVFRKNRERLLNQEIAEAFFQGVLQQAQPFLSDEHFTVDGTLIEAGASQQSCRPQEEGESEGTPREADFPGERRSQDTQPSTTDPEARLYKKSKGSEAKLSYWGHVLLENRHGRLLRTRVTQADGTAERAAALLLASKIPGIQPVPRGGDRNYATRDLVATVRERKSTPHVAQNTTSRSSAMEGRTTRHAGYASSQQKRKRVEPSFGWRKMIGLLKKVKLGGLEKVSGWFPFVGAAYNLMRRRRLRAEPVAGAKTSQDHSLGRNGAARNPPNPL